MCRAGGTYWKARIPGKYELGSVDKVLSRLPADALPKLLPLAFDRSWSGKIARNPATPRCVDINADLRQADLHFAVKRRLCPRS